jgi:hypothetical protein
MPEKFKQEADPAKKETGSKEYEKFQEMMAEEKRIMQEMIKMHATPHLKEDMEELASRLKVAKEEAEIALNAWIDLIERKD